MKAVITLTMLIALTGCITPSADRRMAGTYFADSEYLVFGSDTKVTHVQTVRGREERILLGSVAGASSQNPRLFSIIAPDTSPFVGTTLEWSEDFSVITVRWSMRRDLKFAWATRYDRAMLTYRKRTLADWDAEKAVAEAEQDIQSGKLKVYLSGTIAAFAPCVSAEHYPLVKPLRTADAGIGCLVEDTGLRKAQFEYACRYNERIVRYLVQKEQGHPPSGGF